MDELSAKAKAVELAVFVSLMNALRSPERESYWRTHADKLEQKFINEHGRHYSHFLSSPEVRS